MLKSKKFSANIKPALIKVDWTLISTELEHKNTKILYDYMQKIFKSGHLLTNQADDKGFNLLHHGVLKGVYGKV